MRSRGSGFVSGDDPVIIFSDLNDRGLTGGKAFRHSRSYINHTGKLRSASRILDHVKTGRVFVSQGQIQLPTPARISGMAPESPLMMNWMAMASTKMARNLAMILSSFSPMNRKRWVE